MLLLTTQRGEHPLGVSRTQGMAPLRFFHLLPTAGGAGAAPMAPGAAAGRLSFVAMRSVTTTVATFMVTLGKRRGTRK